jgi:hypothetical protein
MAKVKLSGQAVISGKVGGLVYASNRGGAYIRNWVKPINPNTPAQSAARQQFSNASSSWKGLTKAERTSFNTGQANFPKQDRLGDTIYLSGQQLYMSLNRNLQAIGGNPVTVAPTPIVITAPTFVNVQVDPGQFLIEYTPATLGALDALLIEASVTMSAGVSFLGRSAFKQVFVNAPGSVSPVDILSDYNSIFGTGSLQTGSKVFVRMSIVNTKNGIKSDTIQDEFIVA